MTNNKDIGYWLDNTELPLSKNYCITKVKIKEEKESAYLIKDIPEFWGFYMEVPKSHVFKNLNDAGEAIKNMLESENDKQ